MQEYEIDNNWKSRHATVTPMFLETLDTKALLNPSAATPTTPVKKKKVDTLLATQKTLDFTPTLDGR